MKATININMAKVIKSISLELESNKSFNKKIKEKILGELTDEILTYTHIKKIINECVEKYLKENK